MGLFTVGQARMEIARLRPLLDELVVIRADVVELAAALTTGEPTVLGGLIVLLGVYLVQRSKA